jgi:hypothetical protein
VGRRRHVESKNLGLYTAAEELARRIRAAESLAAEGRALAGSRQRGQAGIRAGSRHHRLVVDVIASAEGGPDRHTYILTD